MNKKLVGMLLVTGAATAVVVATRDRWVPVVRAGAQEVFFWVIEGLNEDEDIKEDPTDRLIEEGSVY